MLTVTFIKMIVDKCYLLNINYYKNIIADKCYLSHLQKINAQNITKQKSQYMFHKKKEIQFIQYDLLREDVYKYNSNTIKSLH